MVKDFGADHVKFLLHSYDRLMIEETVGGVIARNNRSTTPDYRQVHGCCCDSANSKLLQNLRDASRLLAARQNAARLESTPVGNVDPTTTKLPQLEEAKDSIPNGGTHLTNGQSQTGLKALVSMSSSLTVSTPTGSVGASQQYVHITQRPLAPVVGSRVRGAEMLPSVDVPNIPSAASAVASHPSLTQIRTIHTTDTTPPPKAMSPRIRLWLGFLSYKRYKLDSEPICSGGRTPARPLHKAPTRQIRQASSRHLARTSCNS